MALFWVSPSTIPQGFCEKSPLAFNISLEMSYILLDCKGLGVEAPMEGHHKVRARV